jgi:hypothetical protein
VGIVGGAGDRTPGAPEDRLDAHPHRGVVLDDDGDRGFGVH